MAMIITRAEARSGSVDCHGQTQHGDKPEYHAAQGSVKGRRHERQPTREVFTRAKQGYPSRNQSQRHHQESGTDGLETWMAVRERSQSPCYEEHTKQGQHPSGSMDAFRIDRDHIHCDEQDEHAGAEYDKTEHEVALLIAVTHG